MGKDLDTDKAYQAAKRCGLSIVTQAKNACGGDLSKIKYVEFFEICEYGKQPTNEEIRKIFHFF